MALIRPLSAPSTLAVRLALAGLAALVGVLAYPASAHAHSDLASSDPAASSRVTAPPSQLTLTFTDRVNPQFVTIRLATGNTPAVDLPHSSSGQQVTAQVPAGQTPATSQEPAGADQAWTVTYRVVSADGHPISGSYSFTVAGAAPSTTATPTSTPPQTTSTSVPATSPPGSVESAAAPSRGRENATGNRLPAVVMAVIALPLLAAAVGAVWWFRRQGRTRA